MSLSFLYYLALIVLLSSTLAAQTSTTETSQLRELLHLPPGKDFERASQPKLAKGAASLRVFLAVGDDKRIRRYYTRQLKDWNRYKNPDLAGLELVDNIDRADIILARYKLPDQAKASATSVVVNIPTYNPQTRIMEPRLESRTVRSRTVAVRGYILRRTGAEIEILREGVFAETREMETGDYTADGLWTALLELLSAA